MKRLLFMVLLLASLSLTSCNKASSYSVRNETGSSTTVFIHECNDSDETVNIQNATIPNYATRLFNASSNAVKLKIYVEEMDKWVQQVYYLENYSVITLTGKTIIGSEKP